VPSTDPEAAQRDWKDWYRRALRQAE
jgi:hypothetical protein